MKKTFSLHDPRKADARVLDSIKHEVKKYVKRERLKPLPEGFAVWEFACKVGPTAGAAEAAPLKEVSRAIDAAAATAGDEIYVEVIAVPAQRVRSSFA